MHRQASSVDIIRLLTEQVEHLRIDHGDQKIKCGISIRHDQEKRCFPVSQRIQLQFIVHGDIPDFLNIKRSKSCAAADKYTFQGLAGSHLELHILSYCKMIWVLLFQPLKKDIHRVLALFIIFPDIHRIEHLQKCRKVLLFFRCLVMNVSDQRLNNLFLKTPEHHTSNSLKLFARIKKMKERLPFSRQPAVIQRSEHSLAVILFRVIIIRFRNNLPINYVSCGKGFLQRAKQTEWPAPLSPPGTDSDVQCIHDRNVSFIHISILLSGNHRPLISLLPGKRGFPESF